MIFYVIIMNFNSKWYAISRQQQLQDKQAFSEGRVPYSVSFRLWQFAT